MANGYPNDPRALSAAVAEVIDDIGYHDACAAVAKSRSLLEKWRNPESQSEPDFAQMVALDVAFERVTGRRGPIITLYGERLAHLAVTDPDGAPAPEAALVDLGIAAGRVMETVRSAIHPDGDEGHIITPREKVSAMKAVTMLRRVASQLEDAIEAASRPVR